MRRILSILVVLFIVVVAFGLLYAQSADRSIFQVSTWHALKQGMYDGETTYGELKKHGDFGIGTLNGLDGEMVALNHEFFQIKADGRVHPITDDKKTPFAVVTFFKPDKKFSLPAVNDMRELAEALDRMLTPSGKPCAIRIDGEFTHVKVRSVPRQERPYPGIDDALKHQTFFELKNVRGTLVGFRFPGYFDGVNVPGFHFHFITADKQAGGHVLDCSTAEANVEVAVISNLSVRFLEDGKDGKSAR
ncbi:MAG: acetolactate decarboxylase [Thermodesulfobacteriota bacterium]